MSTTLTIDQVTDIINGNQLQIGRMVSGTKSAPKGTVCVWNANIITRSHGKVWFGDLNLTRDYNNLVLSATMIGEPLYVLRESDCRFRTAGDSIEELINRAVWNTTQPKQVG